MKQILDIEVESWHLDECLEKFEKTPFALALEDHLKIRNSGFFCWEYERGTHFWKDTKKTKDIRAEFLSMTGLYVDFYKFVKAYDSIRTHEPPDMEDILDMADAYRMIKVVYPFSFQAEVEIG